MYGALFLDGSRRVLETKAEEMNQSCIHVFTLLYQATSRQQYLNMARHIEQDWQVPPSGDYLRSALDRKAFYQCPKPRWESLPSIQAMGELYYVTGDEKYKQAFENMWWSNRRVRQTQHRRVLVGRKSHRQSLRHRRDRDLLYRGLDGSDYRYAAPNRRFTRRR